MVDSGDGAVYPKNEGRLSIYLNNVWFQVVSLMLDITDIDLCIVIFLTYRSLYCYFSNIWWKKWCKVTNVFCPPTPHFSQILDLSLQTYLHLVHMRAHIGYIKQQEIALILFTSMIQALHIVPRIIAALFILKIKVYN